MQYRQDIDGLRALAVLAVIGFHAFPHIIPGGFVGVDVFFVISGYLITGIIHTGLERGSFSIAAFYARRIRRIFPALIVVFAAILLLGWHVLLDDEFRQLGKHVAAGAAFLSNFVLWNEAGYFDGDSILKPFLHLWSLGLEEQFYILWPLMLMGAFWWKVAPARLAALIALSSFIACLCISGTSSVAAFYSPLTRAWELALGALLALSPKGAWLPNSRATWLAHALMTLRTELYPDKLAWLGLFLIGIAVAGLDHHTVFPGWWALLPTLGTVALLVAGPQAWVNARLLSHPTMVMIGLISFPLYLWHWPLLSLERIVSARQPSSGSVVVAVLVAFALAWMTYELIEMPVRRRRSAPVFALTGMMIVLGIVGMASFAGTIRPWSAFFGLEKVTATGADPVFPGDELRPFAFQGQVFYQTGQGEKTSLYIGDSTMQVYFLRIQAVIQALPDPSRRAVFAASPGCVPIPGVRSERTRLWCNAFMRQAYTLALDPSVDTVVIGANWYQYFLNASEFVDYVYDDGSKTMRLGFDPYRSREAYAALGQSIGNLVRHNKKVYLILDTPFGNELSPVQLIRRTLLRGFDIQPAYLDQAKFVNMTSVVSKPLRKVGEHHGATMIDPVASLCNGTVCPALTETSYPIYKDSVHLRTTYVRDHVTYLDLTVEP
jgi:peptidoglycan/LPS O-acetylase OafA/YrhL